MGKRTHDRVALIEAFLEAKTVNPKISLREFCATKGLSYRYMSRIIGTQVVLAWDRVVAKTVRRTENRLAAQLASTLASMAEKERAIFFRGAEALVPTEKPERGMKPADLEEALDLMTAGARAYKESLRVLYGDAPLDQPPPEEHTFKWNEPTVVKGGRAKRASGAGGKRKG